jgi:hypothetical protein
VQKKALNIVFPGLLIANLLFSQVALNFFHSKDSEQHEAFNLSHACGSLVHQHSEHCKVCALDTLFHFLKNPETDLIVPPLRDVRIFSLKVEVEVIRVSFSQGRAPPAFI